MTWKSQTECFKFFGNVQYFNSRVLFWEFVHYLSTFLWFSQCHLDRPTAFPLNLSQNASSFSAPFFLQGGDLPLSGMHSTSNVPILIIIMILNYPNWKFHYIKFCVYFFNIICFLPQPLPRTRPAGSSLGSYRSSSGGQTGSLSSPRQYPNQFGSPLRSQAFSNKLDRTSARWENTCIIS